MSTLNDNDLFVYQEAATGNVGAVANNNRSSLADDDLFVVWRGGVNYKVKASDVGGGGGGDLTTVTLAPLSLTIDPDGVNDITAVTNLTSILPGSEITFQWYQYEAATGGTGTPLQTTVSDTAIQDTYTVGGANQGKYIGCTVTYLGTPVTETARSQINTAAVPVADMNGLRFDSTRAAYLSRGFSSAGNQTTATCSFWIKRGTVGTTQYIFGSSSAQTTITLNTANQLSGNLRGTGGTNYSWATTNTFTDVSTWHHVVVAWDSSQAVDTDRCKIYVDGVVQSLSTAQYCPQNTALFTNDTRKIGTHSTGISFFDGYLSDVYFVDGQALEPTAFAKEFVLGWGPLDSSTVIENIGDTVVQPFDTRPNMDEEWSSYAVSNGAEPWSKAFDGVVNDAFNTNEATSNTNATPVVWTKTGDAIPFNTLEVWSRKDYLDPAQTGKISINGLDVTDQITPNAPAWYSIDLTGATNSTSLESISMWSTYGGGVMRLGGVRIDGRLLVDGPADNSQNWSTSGVASGQLTAPISGVVIASNIAGVFDGALDTGIGMGGGTNDISPFIWTLDNPIDYTDKVRFWTPSNSTGMGVHFNDTNIPVGSNNSAGEWVTVVSGSSGTFRNFGFYNSNNSGSGTIAVNAIEVDGKLLVDGGALWNTSQVWSDNVIISGTALAVSPVTRMFNGNINSGFGLDSGSATFTSSIPEVTSLRIRAASGQATGNITINNSADVINIAFEKPVAWYEVTDVPSTFTGLTITKNSGVDGQAIYAQAIEINGKILVDAGSFGTNGFYLPFDPTQTGELYSDTLVSDQTFVANRGPSKAFNGVISQNNDDHCNGGNAATMNWTGYTAGTYNVRVWGFRRTTQVIKYYTIDSAGDPQNEIISRNVIGTDNTYGWLDFGSVADFTGIRVVSTDGTTGPILGAVEIDGSILIDHNSIGHDASGNGNHFHDENFAAGNASQTWSKCITTNNGNYAPNGGYGPKEAFNGDTSTPCASQSSGASAWVEFKTSVPADSKISVFTRLRNVIEINGSEVRAQGGDATTAWSEGYDCSGATTIRVYGYGPTSGTAEIYAVRVNGQVLIDADIQDTVFDTPMRNYAVMDSENVVTAVNLSNGNLQGTSSVEWRPAHSTIQVTSGKYYFEVNRANAAALIVGAQNPAVTGAYSGAVYNLLDGNKILTNEDGSGATSQGFVDTTGIGKIVGVAADKDNETIEFFKQGTSLFSLNTEAWMTSLSVSLAASTIGTINYGQQPFAYATRNEDGTVTIPAAYNTSEVWTSGLSTTGTWTTYEGGGTNPVSNNLGLFDGNDDTSISAGGGVAYTWAPVGGLDFTDNVQVRKNPAAAGLATQVSVNGGANQTLTDTVTVIATGGGTINSIVVTPAAGQNPFVTQIIVDGSILVDSDVWNASQNWSDGTQSNPTTNRPLTYLFDGDLTTLVSAPNVDDTPNLISLVNDITVGSKVQLYATIAGYNSGPYVLLKDGVEQGRYSPPNGTTTDWYEVPNMAGKTFNQIQVSRKLANDGGYTGSGLAAIKVDDVLLVDAGGGTFNTLYQTWSEWVTATTRALLARSESRVDALEQIILTQAVDWSYGSTYSSGDLVKFNCSVWRATSDGITTRTPIPNNSDIWENLYIDCERTHTMDDLIPDNWSQEQRRAALQELLLELSEDEPEGY